MRPIECLAVARYALGARAARAGSIDNQYTREAFDRINAYGDQPGEFKRASRGLNLDMRARVAPPALIGRR